MRIIQPTDDHLHDAARQIYAQDITHVLLPETESDLVHAINASLQQGTYLTVQGGRTGLGNGAVPTTKSIILDMSQMLTSIIPEGFEPIISNLPQGTLNWGLDRETNQAVFPPGVTLDQVDEVIRPYNLRLSVNPTCGSAQLGGAFSTGASGSRSFMFGSIDDAVKRARVILPTGKTVDLTRGQQTSSGPNLNLRTTDNSTYNIPLPTYGHPNLDKNAAGLIYKGDALDLFIGAQGMGGAVSMVQLELDYGRQVNTGMILFNNYNAALDFAMEVRSSLRGDKELYRTNPQENNLGLLSLEFFDGNALKYGTLPKGNSFPTNATAAIEYEIFKGDDSTFENLVNLLERYDSSVIDSMQGDQDVIDFRKSIPDNVNSVTRRAGVHKVGTDLSVPNDQVKQIHVLYQQAMAEFTSYCGERETPATAMWGHGPWHVHLNFIPTNQRELGKAMELYTDLLQMAIRLGGSPSGEHGLAKKYVTVNNKRVSPLEHFIGQEGLKQTAATYAPINPGLRFCHGNLGTLYIR